MSSWCWIMSNFHYFCLLVQSAGAKNWTVSTALSSESHPDIPNSTMRGKMGKARLWALQSTICGCPAMKSATAAEGKSWHASPLVVSVYCPLWVAFWYWGTEASLVSQNGQPFCGSRSASISVSYLRQVDLWPDLHPCTSLYSMSQNDVYHKIAMLFLGDMIINQWMEWVNCRLSLRIAAICFIHSKAGCSRRMGVRNGSKSCAKIWMVKYYNIL